MTDDDVRVDRSGKFRDYTLSVAHRLLRAPAPVWALTKDNLNQAEDDADRRRYLFASEAANQIRYSQEMASRMRKRAEASSAAGQAGP